MAQNLTNEEISKLIYPIRYPLYISYLAFGTPAVLTNLAILAILLSDKKLLSKSPMIAGLAGGNLLNGLHGLGYGIYRLPLLFSNRLDLPASNWMCMASLLPTCMLLGTLIPALMQLIIGLERLVAIVAYNWYRVHWSPRKNWYVVGVIYILIIGTWVMPTWYQVFANYRLVTKECSAGTLFGISEIDSLFFFIIVTSTSGVLCTLTAVVKGYFRYKKLSSSASSHADVSRCKKQLHMSKTMVIIALFELCFVAVPDFFIVLMMLGLPIPQALATYGVTISCTNSATNIFVYLVMNRGFRKTAFDKLIVAKSFLCKRFCGDNQVTPVIN